MATSVKERVAPTTEAPVTEEPQYDEATMRAMLTDHRAAHVEMLTRIRAEILDIREGSAERKGRISNMCGAGTNAFLHDAGLPLLDGPGPIEAPGSLLNVEYYNADGLRHMLTDLGTQYAAQLAKIRDMVISISTRYITPQRRDKFLADFGMAPFEPQKRLAYSLYGNISVPAEGAKSERAYQTALKKALTDFAESQGGKYITRTSEMNISLQDEVPQTWSY